MRFGQMLPRWRVVTFLTIAYALNYADRSALSSVLPALKSELALSKGQRSIRAWSSAA